MSKLDPFKDEIEGRLVSGQSQREIARRFGVGKSTLQDFIKSRDIPVPEPQKIKIDGSHPIATGTVDELEMLQHEVRELRALHRKDRKADVAAERVLAEIRAHVAPAEVTFEPPDLDAVREGSGGKDHVQLLLLSDLHGGEVVSLEQTDGMNEYNWEILQGRMDSILRSLISYQNNRAYPITELHIAMLGDMTSGSHHKELADTNEFPDAEAGWRMGDMLGKFVEALVEHFPRIVVWGVSGNHPRLSQKPSNKNVFDNFDWMSYKVAELYCRNYETVEWHIPNAGYIVAEVGGQNLLLFHGDGIRSSMPGVPWGGVMRRWAQLKSQYLQRGIVLDAACLGHFHQSAVVDGIYMNGSVKGVDEYSIKNFGAGQRPTQLLLTFLPEKRRLTDVSYITP